MSRRKTPMSDETLMPTVVARCRRCGVTEQDVASGQVVVSSNGVAHHSLGLGRTGCGKDATGNGWWWPL